MHGQDQELRRAQRLHLTGRLVYAQHMGLSVLRVREASCYRLFLSAAEHANSAAGPVVADMPSRALDCGMCVMMCMQHGRLMMHIRLCAMQ